MSAHEDFTRDERDERDERDGSEVSTGGPRVRELAIYPVKDEPGVRLADVAVQDAGLAGDRRKKRPVHLVGAGETPETTRANIFLDLPDAQVAALLECTVRLGDAVLHVTERPSGCPGVATTGRVALGDALTIL